MLSAVSIKNQIDIFVSELKALDIMLSVTASKNVQNTFNQFELLLKKYPLNPLLLTRFLTFIQLIDDEQLLKEFSLNEIEYLFERLSTIYENDLELNLDYLLFQFNVQDKEEEALEKFKTFKSHVEVKLMKLI
jgi:hypothetical protein